MRHLYLAALCVALTFTLGCDDDAASPPSGDNNVIVVPDDACEGVSCGDNEACVEGADGAASCECIDGAERDDGGACVTPVDVSCEDIECGDHGTCELVGGTPRCQCDEGFAGAECAVCDAGAGYEPDGQGGCSPDQGDPCDPNPCFDPMRTVCVRG